MGFEPTTLRVLEGRGFESHLRLRFVLCPFMVDSLPLSFVYDINISGISIIIIILIIKAIRRLWRICGRKRISTSAGSRPAKFVFLFFHMENLPNPPKATNL